MRVLIIILISSVITHSYSQEKYDLFYVADDTKIYNNLVHEKVNEVISETQSYDIALYVNYYEQDVIKVYDKTNLKNIIIQDNVRESTPRQIKKISDWFNSNDWFNDLLNGNSNNQILNNKISLHFFFDGKDFFQKAYYKHIVEEILNINRLNSYKNGEKSINENCNVIIYLRGNEFIKDENLNEKFNKENNYKIITY
tara:strand:- start:264 stop:857 length:594 start_codon:yes stop_codon:yes gene_type:complete